MTDFAPSGPPIPAVAGHDDPTAVIGRRILAWVLDLLIFLAIVGGLFAGLADYVEIPPVFPLDACDVLQERYADEASGCLEVGDRAYITSTGDNGVQTLASLGYLAFFVVMQGITGASPGKLLTGLRVVDERGAIAGVGRSLGRTLLWVVDGAPWIVPAVGFITGLTSTGHRRVGDLAAKTYVVTRADVGRPPFPSLDTFGLGMGQAPWVAPGPPVGPVGTNEPVGAPLPDVSEAPSQPPPPDVSAPVDEAPPELGADPSWWAGPTTEQADSWAPPTTPGDEFGTVDSDASPTAGPTPFAAPGSEAPAPGDVPTPLPPPQWDPARNTYLQWHPAQQAWLQWDAVAARWKPLDT